MLKYTCTGFSLFPSSVPLDVVVCGVWFAGGASREDAAAVL